MTTVAPTVAALEQYCGFGAGRVRANVRALTEGGLIAPGAPGVSVQISEADFVLVLLAVASAAPLHAVADTVAKLASLVPNGIDVDVMPAGIRPAKRTAFDVLHEIVWSAAHGDIEAQARVSKINIEVVGTWPEVSMHTAEGIVRFQPVGALAGHWGGNKQRRATIIPGSALVDCVRALFAKEA